MKTVMNMNREIVKYNNELGNIAEVFRMNDRYIQGLELRDRTFYNNIGKILEDIGYIISKYNRASEYEKIRIMNSLSNVIRSVDDAVKHA